MDKRTRYFFQRLQPGMSEEAMQRAEDEYYRVALAAKDAENERLRADNEKLRARQAEVFDRPDKGWKEVRVVVTDEEIRLSWIDIETILLLKLNHALRGEEQK